MIDVENLSDRQRWIADLLFSCDNIADVDRLVQALGPEADVIKQLIYAACLDDCIDIDIAQAVISNIKAGI